MHTQSTAFSSLYDSAKQLVERTSGAQQIILLQADDGTVHSLLHAAPENGTGWIRFADGLTAGARVRYILCMWHTGELDVPPQSTRKLLEERSLIHDDAVIFLRGENGFAARRYFDLFRPQT